MRRTCLFLLVFMALASVFATLAPNAGSTSEHEGLTRPANQAAPAGSHSVRRKVSPVTYGGRQGHQVAPSPAPLRQDQKALGPDAAKAEVQNTPQAQYRVRLDLRALGAAPDSGIAARECARRLMALVEQGVLSRAPVPALAA